MNLKLKHFIMEKKYCKKDGKGKIIYPDKKEYEGDWMNNKFNGNALNNLENLKNLSYFRLYNCKEIERLDLTNLLSLKEIDINNSIINNLNGIDSLINLKRINLDGSTFHNRFFFPANKNLQISNEKNYFLCDPKLILTNNKIKRV